MLRNTLRITSLSIVMLFFCLQSFAVTSTISIDKKLSSAFVTDIENFDFEAFAKSSRKDIEANMGQKLNLKQRIAYSYSKLKVKRALAQGLTNDEIKQAAARGDFSFHFVGFLAGFFLAIIGVLLVYIFSSSRGARMSSWYGFGFLLLLGILGYASF